MRVAIRELKSLENFPNLMYVHSDGQAARVLPYLIQFPNTNSVETCLSRCSEFGYNAAGLEVCIHPFQYRASILLGHSTAKNAGAETLTRSPRTVES